MNKNIFKGKKIQTLLSTWWYDGTQYKWPEFLKKEFGIDSTRGKIKEDLDLGICWGDVHLLYKEFLKRNIPYLLIEHDVYSLRFGLDKKLLSHDREKMENASAVVFTSEEHVEYYEMLKKKYGWHIPEYIVIHNKPLKKDIEFRPRQKLEGLHLVMAGGILGHWFSPGTKNRAINFNYKAFHHIYRKFIEAGWNIHIYPTKFMRVSGLSEYKDMGCTLHEWIPGDKIYEEMSQYTAGIQANNDVNTPERAFRYSQSTRPNKIYDYLASGIPTIGYQGGKRAMEIYNNKWGIVIDDLELETLKAIPERLKKIKILQRWRRENTMEKEKDKIIYIIKVALKNNKPKKYISSIPAFKEVKAFPKFISVENKGKTIIERANRIFYPDKKTEVFQVNESTFRLIKAHVHLKINIKE